MAISRISVSRAVLAAALLSAGAAQAQAPETVDELVVTGQRLSQQRAIESKRNAAGVIDAISADEIGRLADKNVAENVERLPGVGLAYDQGEGRYVSIRGTPAFLNNVTLNGVEVGNPDGDSRALPLDVVSGQLLGRIEVIKAVTADMDAQGIGGTVNLVSQSPFDFRQDRFARMSVQAGYQAFNEKTPVQGDASIGGLFGEGRWGVLLGASFSSRDYRSDGLFPDDWRAVPGVARGGLPINLKTTNYNLKRERIGLSGALEYRPTDEDTLYLRGLYSRFTEDEYRQRYRLDFAPGSGTPGNIMLNADGATGVATNVEARQDLRLEYKEKSISSGSLGGEHERGPWSLTYDLSYGYNELVEPNQSWLFRGGAFTVDFDMRPLLYTVEPRNATAQALGFRQHTVQDEYGEETNIAAKVDLRRAIDIGAESFFKVGFKVRDTDKRFDGRTDLYDRGTAANRFTLADFGLQGPPMEVDVGDRVYRNPFVIDAAAIQAFTSDNLNTARLVRNTATSLSNNTLNDYDLTERVTAGYAMANVDLGDVTVIAGWRVERTETDVQGFRLTRQTGTVTPVSRSSDYSTFLPNLHLRFEPREDLIVRLAYTRTLGRPQYPQLKPGGALTFTPNPDGTFEGELAEGNVDLRPFVSDNLDATVEWYFAPGGLLSAGAFFKDIKDPIFGFRETQTGVVIEGRTYNRLFYTQPRNADAGEIKGLELAFQQQFTFLPGIWRGFGVAANVTFTDSSLTVPGRGELAFPAQSDLLYGGQLFYQAGRLEAALSYHHTGRAVQSFGSVSDADTYDDDYRRLDAKISYALTDRIEVFADLQNLTDEVLREYQAGRRDWLTNYERYDRTYYLGFTARW